MKKLLITLIVFTFTIGITIAQPQRRPLERIHAAKMAYLIDRLHISSDQSGAFIPLYNDCETEIRNTRKEFKQKYKGVFPDEADDTVSRQYIDDNLDYQEKVIQIKRKYTDRFLKIITPQQLADLPKADREFKQILMRQMEQHRNMGGRGGWWQRQGRDN